MSFLDGCMRWTPARHRPTSAPKMLSMLWANQCSLQGAAHSGAWSAWCAGKNRPLDADEAEFMDAVAEHERLREHSARAEDATAMEAYQIVRRRLHCIRGLPLLVDMGGKGYGVLLGSPYASAARPSRTPPPWRPTRLCAAAYTCIAWLDRRPCTLMPAQRTSRTGVC